MSGHRLKSLLIALLLAVVLLSSIQRITQQLAYRRADVLAPMEIRHKGTGSVLQKEALRRADLLLVYGSSEMMISGLGSGVGEYNASQILRHYPSGFAPFIVANTGVTSLPTMQAVAALGSGLRGKKVVVSFAPSSFLLPTVSPEYYAGNLSRLHAYELAFSPHISFDLKARAARRMLQFPDTLEQAPLLRFALSKLASESWSNRLLYYAVWPLGRFEILVLRARDHWVTLQILWQYRRLQPPERYPAAAIDWQAMAQAADVEQRAHADNNPYGFDSRRWDSFLAETVERGDLRSSDEAFVQAVQASEEWADLDLLLSALHELGAQPLILSRPFNGRFLDAMGVSRHARQAFYDRLGQAVAPYNVTLVDFQEHDEDLNFSTDPWSHTSRKGWVHVSEALERFYHDAPR